MGYERYQELKVDRDGGVLTITLNRPAQQNAVNARMHEEFTRIFTDVRADEEARVIVITGAGDSFCNAADIDWYVTIEETEWLRIIREAKWIIQDIMTVPQPIVIGLNGNAMGFGSSLVTLGDLVIAAEGAVMGDHHAGFGLVCGDGGAMTLPFTMGLNRAKEYLMLGREYSAEELLQMGVVNRVVPRDRLDAELKEVANQLAEMPSEALQWTKTTLNRVVQFSALLSLESAMGHEGWTWHLRPARKLLEDFKASLQEQG
jgi:enoyl-CoA hydratase/carnithine racemase